MCNKLSQYWDLQKNITEANRNSNKKTACINCNILAKLYKTESCKDVGKKKRNGMGIYNVDFY